MTMIGRQRWWQLNCGDAKTSGDKSKALIRGLPKEHPVAQRLQTGTHAVQLAIFTLYSMAYRRLGLLHGSLSESHPPLVVGIGLDSSSDRRSNQARKLSDLCNFLDQLRKM